jgi:intracellular septation protein
MEPATEKREPESPDVSDGAAARAPAELEGWPKLLVDLAPLIVFFATYQIWKRQPGVTELDATVAATVALAPAALLALGYAWLRTRRLPGMLLFSTALVLVFGGLTIWLHDDRFIKMKPTIVFTLFAVLLGGGMLAGRNYLRLVLGKAVPGMSDAGWGGLAWRWAGFFAVLAVLNELTWRFFSTDIWFHFKTWGDTVLTIAFMLALTPYMKKHGARFE